MRAYIVNTNLGYYFIRRAEDEHEAMLEVTKQLIAEGVKEITLTCEGVSMSYKINPIEIPKGEWVPFPAIPAPRKSESGPREPIIDGPPPEKTKEIPVARKVDEK